MPSAIVSISVKPGRKIAKAKQLDLVEHEKVIIKWASPIPGTCAPAKPNPMGHQYVLTLRIAGWPMDSPNVPGSPALATHLLTNTN